MGKKGALQKGLFIIFFQTLQINLYLLVFYSYALIGV